MTFYLFTLSLRLPQRMHPFTITQSRPLDDQTPSLSKHDRFFCSLLAISSLPGRVRDADELRTSFLTLLSFKSSCMSVILSTSLQERGNQILSCLRPLPSLLPLTLSLHLHHACVYDWVFIGASLQAAALSPTGLRFSLALPRPLSLPSHFMLAWPINPSSAPSPRITND